MFLQHVTSTIKEFSLIEVNSERVCWLEGAPADIGRTMRSGMGASSEDHLFRTHTLNNRLKAET